MVAITVFPDHLMEIVEQGEPLFLLQAHLVPGVPQDQPALRHPVELGRRPTPPPGGARAVLSSQLPAVPPPPNSDPESTGAGRHLPGPSTAPLGTNELLLVWLGGQTHHVVLFSWLLTGRRLVLK